MKRFKIGDDVAINATGECGRVTDILHGSRYGVYVPAEEAEDGESYYDEFSENELS